MRKLIVVDPGHGGDDNGAMWGYEEEDDINLSISYLLRCELLQRGYAVKMTREKDEEMSLLDRTNFANISKADLFISIHCDAFHHETASGMSTHVYPGSEKSKAVAQNIQGTLIKNFPGHKNRGVRESNFYVLRKTWMLAVLCEMEFLSNPDTRRFLREPENQLALARAITNGIGI